MRSTLLPLLFLVSCIYTHQVTHYEYTNHTEEHSLLLFNHPLSDRAEHCHQKQLSALNLALGWFLVGATFLSYLPQWIQIIWRKSSFGM